MKLSLTLGVQNYKLESGSTIQYVLYRFTHRNVKTQKNEHSQTQSTYKIYKEIIV